MKKKVLACLISTIFTVGAANASTTKVQKDNSVDNKTKYQHVIDDYKKYLGTVSKDVLHEIKDFRTEIEKLRKQKKDLYGKLSQEAQAHLAKEREFKHKLPKQEHSKMNNDISE